MKYRSDIDGLRAIAVLSVVIFHLKIGILSGGFVGVDIFFVISGYLISKIIFTELNSGTFSIATFYVRRARRIIPALVSMLLVTSLLSYFLLFPSELKNYANSAIASALFSANIFFFSTLNYFSPSAEEIPLLHLWSLGIEEQFYIFFPLLAILCSKINRTYTAAIITITLLVSLCYSQYMLAIDPTQSFYLLPSRAFELLIGAFIALPILRIKQSAILSHVLFITGILALGYAIVFFNENMQFPGLAAALPCFGTALVILAGERPTRISKTLGWAPLVFFGKVSYSLYLVHWPAIVFAKRYFTHTDPTLLACGIFAGSVVLAWLNYRFIEQRFRHTPAHQQPRIVLSGTATILLTIILIAGFVSYKQGFPNPADGRVNKALAMLQYNPTKDYLSRTCFLDPDQPPTIEERASCLPSTKGKTAILWGDSHAIHLYGGMKETFASRGISLGALTASACPPVLDIDVAARPYCRASNTLDFELITKIRPDILIMTAGWSPDPVTMAALSATLDKASKLGIKIVVLGESPIYKKSVPLIVADRIKSGSQDLNSKLDLDQPVIDSAEKAVSSLVATRTDIRYISVFKAICPNGYCPMATADDIPLHYDIAHLTPEGSKYFAKELTPLIIK